MNSQKQVKSPLFLTVSRLRNLRRQIVCMLALLPVFVGMYYVAFLLRYDGELGERQFNLFLVSLPVVVIVKCTVFSWFKVYQAWSRHVTFQDLVVLGQAAVGSSLGIALINYMLFPHLVVPRSVSLMDFGATLLVVGGLRVTWRLVQEGKRQFFVSADKQPIFIVGAAQAGESLLRTLKLNPQLPYRVVGFVSSGLDQTPGYLGGVPVLGALQQTCQLAEKFDVKEVLVAAGDLSGRQIRQLIEDCRASEVDVRVMPGFDELLSGALAMQPRPVSIEDLLRREPVQLETDQIHSWLTGRIVMVTGSSGSIGSEICRQLLQFNPKKLILVDRSENGQFFIDREFKELNQNLGIELEVCIADIGDSARMRQVFLRHRPDVVFHAAAYKHVPLMEANPGEAIKNTTLATRCVADLANEFGIQSFVMVSTDKAVNPTSVMGAAKRVAELYVQSLAESSRCRFVTVRFGNVLDSAGSVVPIFREQIACGGPVTVTDPRMQRFFMTIPEAAQLVIQAGTMGQGGEIFILDMGEPVRIVDLAEDVIRLSGLKVGEDIEIKFTGLRPGEKLYEELHVDGEVHLPTQHAKIMVAVSNQVDHQEISLAIKRLEFNANSSPSVVVGQLKEILPEYSPSQPVQFIGPRFKIAA